MSKGNECVYPSDNYTVKGITLREYYAGLALQGLISNSSIELIENRMYAELAVKMADALLTELEKPKQ